MATSSSSPVPGSIRPSLVLTVPATFASPALLPDLDPDLHVAPEAEGPTGTGIPPIGGCPTWVGGAFRPGPGCGGGERHKHTGPEQGAGAT